MEKKGSGVGLLRGRTALIEAGPTQEIYTSCQCHLNSEDRELALHCVLL